MGFNEDTTEDKGFAQVAKALATFEKKIDKKIKKFEEKAKSSSSPKSGPVAGAGAGGFSEKDMIPIIAQIESNTANIAVEAANQAIQDAAIAANQGNISDNNADIDQNTTTIGQNSTEIQENEDDIRDNEVADAALTARVDALDTQVADNSSSIVTAVDGININSANITSLDNTLVDLSVSVDTLEDRADGLDIDFQNLDNGLSNLESSVDMLETSQNAQDAVLSQHSGEIINLQGNLQTTQAMIQVNTDGISNNSAAISTNTDDITGLSLDVAGNLTKIDENEVSIDALESSQDAQDILILALQEELASVQSRVGEQGDNLIYNGYGWTEDNTNFPSQTYNAVDNSFSHTAAVSTTLGTEELVKVIRTQDYTYSMLAKTDTDGKLYIGINGFDANKEHIAPFHVAFRGASLCTLTQDFDSAVDTVMHVSDASGWKMYPGPDYRNGLGFVPHQGYNDRKLIAPFNQNMMTKMAKPGGSIDSVQQITAIDLVNNTITWSKPPNIANVSGGTTFFIGDTARQAKSGASYAYIISNYSLSTEWEAFTVDFGESTWRKGTEYVQLAMLLNRDSAGTCTHTLKDILLTKA